MSLIERFLCVLAPVIVIAACTMATPQPYGLTAIPALDDYCLQAQRLVTRTLVPMQLVVHEDFDAFVKSKAQIEGPTIYQYNWKDDDGNVQGISCKMKNADHLNLAFGEESAGPEGFCQDMNRQVYGLVSKQVSGSAFSSVVFDLSEQPGDGKKSSMPGPDWLVPFTLTYADDAKNLHVATKGFVIEFTDPRFQKFPATWRGTHYCHFIAPDYLSRLLQGNAETGAVVGHEVVRSLKHY